MVEDTAYGCFGDGECEIGLGFFYVSEILGQTCIGRVGRRECNVP